MKKLILTSLTLLFSILSFGQLTGSKNIPGDFTKVTEANTVLNTSGVDPEALIFNIVTGYTETSTNASADLITAVETAANPIIFRKSGPGLNYLLPAYSGTAVPCSASHDRISAYATTLCSAVSIFQMSPWIENFESLTIPAIPGCWFKPGGSWVTTNNFSSSRDADAHSGIQFLRESYGVTNDYIWTPGFALSAGTHYDFSFWWAGDGYAGWTGDVFYNTTQSSTGASQLGTSFVTAGTTTTKTYAKVDNTFFPPTSGTYYFAIRVNATSNPWYLSFDDFMMEQVETCPGPIFLTASPLSFQSVLGWTDVAGLQSWDIEWGPIGFFSGTGTLISNVSNPYTLTGLTPATSYSYYVRGLCGTNHSLWSGPCNFSTLPNAENKTLNLAMFIQGLYSGNGLMRMSMDASGPRWGEGIADKITVELHEINNYNNVIYSESNVNLGTNGTATITLPSAYNGTYYLTVKHRNSIETVSMNPVSFESALVNYDFDLQTKAYGNNLLMMTDGRWVIYSGDVNQDGYIDSNDITIVINDAITFGSGYIASDVNGDGLIDSGDMNIIDNNAAGFVTKATP
jgi:hypothetical protein